MPKQRKRNNRKPRGRRTRSRLPRAKRVSETKLLKQITPEAALKAFTTPLVAHIPYTVNLNTSWNPILTTGGTTQADHDCKNFILNGTGYTNRIGRQITIMNCAEKHIFKVQHNGEAGGTFPPVAEFRIVQGWCKEGIDAFPQLLSNMPSLYAELNWANYKVIKDYIISRRAYYSGLQTGGTSLAPGNASLKAVPTYDNIKINCSWRTNRPTKFNLDTGGIPPAKPAQFIGWCPFLLILNPNKASLQLTQRFCKNTISFKDL